MTFAIPKLKKWDVVALASLIAALAAAAANLQSALSSAAGQAIGGSLTLTYVGIQLLICSAGLLILGKTAKEGTLWGNLAAVGAMMAGMSGILLAATLWTAA